MGGQGGDNTPNSTVNTFSKAEVRIHPCKPNIHAYVIITNACIYREAESYLSLRR